MSSLNRASLIGNLGADPEIRRTGAGAKVASLRIATSESWKDKASGERKERTEWHSVVIFNENLAEIAEKYLRKGSKVFVEGQIQTRKWQANDGSDRWSTEIVLRGFAGQIVMLGQRGDRPPPASEDDYGAARTSTQSAAAPASGGGTYRDPMDDDIPFAPEVR
ncbi:single-stranded DNA-binding protein [Methylopila musalis]|uniref:Single-stranded DNA-binding protein n=1 Tax=Methylopila musalis TaxID=1134781 RepID=A0ABW3Z3H6_9HYPH